MSQSNTLLLDKAMTSFADLSVRDTARAMRCPENTVKTHTRRALDALRSSGLLDDAIEIDDEEAG